MSLCHILLGTEGLGKYIDELDFESRASLETKTDTENTIIPSDRASFLLQNVILNRYVCIFASRK